MPFFTTGVLHVRLNWHVPLGSLRCRFYDDYFADRLITDRTFFVRQLVCFFFMAWRACQSNTAMHKQNMILALYQCLVVSLLRWVVQVVASNFTTSWRMSQRNSSRITLFWFWTASSKSSCVGSCQSHSLCLCQLLNLLENYRFSLRYLWFFNWRG